MAATRHWTAEVTDKAGAKTKHNVYFSHPLDHDQAKQKILDPCPWSFAKHIHLTPTPGTPLLPPTITATSGNHGSSAPAPAPAVDGTPAPAVDVTPEPAVIPESDGPTVVSETPEA